MEGILVLVDGMDEAEFRRSRLARAEVHRQLQLIAGTLGAMPDEGRRALPEIDWDGWQTAGKALAPGASVADTEDRDEVAWFAATSLVPATISWLRLYRRTEPGLFEFRVPGAPVPPA